MAILAVPTNADLLPSANVHEVNSEDLVGLIFPHNSFTNSEEMALTVEPVSTNSSTSLPFNTALIRFAPLKFLVHDTFTYALHTWSS